MSNASSDSDGRREELSGGLPSTAASDVTLRRLGDALRGIRFGSVVAIVQDGVVVQIEKTEKTRYGR